MLSLGYVALRDGRPAETAALLTEATRAYAALGDLGPASYGLDGLAAVAAGAGAAGPAAALLGAAETMREATATSAAFEPGVREQALATVRGALGEAALDRARDAGRGLGLEAALALAADAIATSG